jgi:hypothetical protein
MMTNAKSWPNQIEILPQQVPHARMQIGLSVTFVNHATMLIQVDGPNILTDLYLQKESAPFTLCAP